MKFTWKEKGIILNALSFVFNEQLEKRANSKKKYFELYQKLGEEWLSKKK